MEECLSLFTCLWFQHDAFADHYGADNADLKEDPSSQLSLEDLCRAHLVQLHFFILPYYLKGQYSYVFGYHSLC